MFLGAAIDAGVALDAIVAKIDALGLPGTRLTAETVRRRGFRGTKIHVQYAPEHVHRHLKDVVRILEAGQLDPRERELADRVFRRLAEAEAHVHGTTVEKVHFHEVGAIDSIVDVVGGCVAWVQLGVERTVASPVPVGGGFIQIAHGRCRVPAPATAELLKGVPIAESPCDAELTTPTGAALLACLVDEFGPLPPMRVTSIGYGAGDHDFSTHANLLRLVVGETAVSDAESDDVTCLETNLDDTTGESIAHCMDRLLAAGALDAFATSILMKKGRPGVQLSVLCEHHDRTRMEQLMFRETNTIGVRRYTVHRSKLPREQVTVATSFGDVQGKVVRLPDGSSRFSAEFESCRQTADAHGVPLQRVAEEAMRNWAME
jgi:hypothetical protein